MTTAAERSDASDPATSQAELQRLIWPSGHELAQRLLRSRPGLKVLYVSGYLEGAAGEGNPLEAGANFLQKPFTPDALVRKVREILDAEAR